jgi:hypothetical protein
MPQRIQLLTRFRADRCGTPIPFVALYNVYVFNPVPNSVICCNGVIIVYSHYRTSPLPRNVPYQNAQNSGVELSKLPGELCKIGTEEIEPIN